MNQIHKINYIIYLQIVKLGGEKNRKLGEETLAGQEG